MPLNLSGPQRHLPELRRNILQRWGCPGTDRERIETLEAKVSELEDQIREILQKLFPD